METDGYAPARARMIEGLRALRDFGMSLGVEIDTADDPGFLEESQYLLEGYTPAEIEEMDDHDFDGYLLLDLVRNVVVFPIDGDIDPGDFAAIVTRCAAVAGDAFPAVDIVEKAPPDDIVERKIDRDYRVTWRVGDTPFKAKGETWTHTDVINQGVTGPAKFFQGSWEMCGYLVYLTPEQAAAANEARGWHLYD